MGDNKGVVGKIMEDLELRINNKYEVNGEYFDTKEDAEEELNKVKKILALNGFKVTFYSRLGYDLEKRVKYFVVNMDNLNFSSVNKISVSAKDIIKVYLEYTYGSSLGFDDINNGLIKKYEVEECDKKDMKKMLDKNKSNITILDKTDIVTAVKNTGIRGY